MLGAVERGLVTLIGATTENPSFEVISPLLSRCQVYILKELEKDDLKKLIVNAVEVLKEDFKKEIIIEEDEALMQISGIGEATVKCIVSQKVLQRAEEEMDFIEKHDVKPLFYLDQDYCFPF